MNDFTEAQALIDSFAAPDEYVVLAKILETSKYDRDIKDGEVEGWGRKWLP